MHMCAHLDAWVHRCAHELEGQRTTWCHILHIFQAQSTFKKKNVFGWLEICLIGKPGSQGVPGRHQPLSPPG